MLAQTWFDINLDWCQSCWIASLLFNQLIWNLACEHTIKYNKKNQTICILWCESRLNTLTIVWIIVWSIKIIAIPLYVFTYVIQDFSLHWLYWYISLFSLNTQMTYKISPLCMSPGVYRELYMQYIFTLTTLIRFVYMEVKIEEHSIGIDRNDSRHL